MRRLLPAVLLAASVSAVMLLVAAPEAPAATSFCHYGSGAGQCHAPTSIAVDQSEGDPAGGRVYVADQGNHRLNAFNADGEFLFAVGWGVADGITTALQKCTVTCFKGIAGNGGGQLKAPFAVAVDNSGGPSAHAVYVYDGGNRRVVKFDSEGGFLTAFGSLGEGPGQFSGTESSVAVGPDGVVHVGDGERIQKFTEAGALLGAIEMGQSVRGVAVDSAGSIYVAGRAAVLKLNPAGVPYGAPYPVATGMESYRPLTVDRDGNLYVARSVNRLLGGPGHQPIARYSPAGEQLRSFGYEDIQFAGRSLAPAVGGGLFRTEEYVGSETAGNKVKYLTEPPLGPVAVARPPSLVAGPIGNTKATLKAEVNPEGKPTTFHYELITEADYQAAGEAFGAGTIVTPEKSLSGSDFEVYLAEALAGCSDPQNEIGVEGKCLVPETDYRFRIVATNADGASTTDGQPFTTRPPLDFGQVWSSEVGIEAARLSAEVNPLGIPTTGHFEYVSETRFAQSGWAGASRAPVAGELDFGVGEQPLVRSAAISGLTPGTSYRYRILATDPLLEGDLAGPEGSFKTFAPWESETCPGNAAHRTGFSALLPDCRAYELVTPLQKGNTDVLALGEATHDHPSAVNRSDITGSKLTYTTNKSFGDAVAAPIASQYLATRSETAWESTSLSPPRGPLILPISATLNAEFKAFTPDLCNAWLRTITDRSLSHDAVPHYPNIYRRHNPGTGCTGQPGTYESLTTVEPPNGTPKNASLGLQGISADGTRGLFVAQGRRAGGAPEAAGAPLLYLSAAGEQYFVCMLPNGLAHSGGCSAGTSPSVGSTAYSIYGNFQNALSANGNRVYWSSSAGGPAPLYLRVNPTEPQSAVAVGTCTESQKACTYPVSAEAEALSGTTSSRFWAAAADGGSAFFTTGTDLYRYRLADKQVTKIAAGVPGVVGTSIDATRIYFPSTEVLSPANAAGEAPSVGEPNLYLYETGGAGSYEFIGTLEAADVDSDPPNGRTSAVSIEPFERSSRVSADGLQVAFTSFAPLTGYDNTDVNSGEPASEVFLYDARGAGELVCASCNPSGSRPTAADISTNRTNEMLAAASIDGWQDALHPGRFMAEDGSRLYFEASDALVIDDTNGVADVYQWERPGSGACTTASPAYSDQNRGCVDLISSGKSVRKSEFVETSPSGNDVFFATLSGLLPHDYGLIDIYDARVGGGQPIPSSPPPGCEGEACQGPAAPPAQVTPSSATFRGAGNVVPPKATKPRRCGKGKRKVRQAGKPRCVPRKAAKQKPARAGGQRSPKR